MTQSIDAAQPTCDPEQEVMLHLYLDGELPFESQSALFEHLAACPVCRRDMDATLAFRRFSRQEHLTVPPQADDMFLERLALQKARNAKIDRREDRVPLWQSRKAVPLRMAIAAAIVLFTVGLFWAQPTQESMAIPVYVSIEEELVETPPYLHPFLEPDPNQVYIFYPGLTVEAVKTE